MIKSKNTREEFEQLRSEYLNQLYNFCFNCESTEDLHMHHIVPLALGGTNRITNMAMLCVDCHSKVHGRNSLHYIELQREGIEEAKKRGVYKGRAIKLTPCP